MEPICHNHQLLEIERKIVLAGTFSVKENCQSIALVRPEQTVLHQCLSRLEQLLCMRDAKTVMEQPLLGLLEQILESDSILLRFCATPVSRHKNRYARTFASLHQSLQFICAQKVHASC